MEQHTVIVVGAGPAGLATAARLHRAGMRPVVLERADAVGASWRGRYDRLRLNSPRWYSTLPGGRWRPGTAVFPSRDDVVDHLETYAADEDIDIRLGIDVASIDRDGDAWVVATSAGDLRAPDVVVATGHSNVPHVPAWPGRDRFAGLMLHAADYRSPGALPGARRARRRVRMHGRGDRPRPRRGRGRTRPSRSAHTAEHHAARADRRAARGGALASPDADLRRRRPVRAPPDGRRSRRVRPARPGGGRLQPPAAAARRADDRRSRRFSTRSARGRIEIVAGVDALDDTGVLLADGDRIGPDTVIAATGYRTGLEPLVGHLGVLDDHGSPLVTDGEAAPGLRFVGFVPRPALLHAVGREAERVARGIVRTRRSTRPAARPVRLDDRAWMGDFVS